MSVKALLLSCCTLCCTLIAATTYGQSDSIYLHSGAVIGGHVQVPQPHVIAYTTWKSEVQKIVSRYAVRNVSYAATGGEATGSPRIDISGEGDWEKVIVLRDKAETAGLAYAAELNVRGGGKFVDSAQAERQAMTSLKKAAARLQCPFVYISSSKIRESGYVGRLIRKSAVAYKY